MISVLVLICLLFSNTNSYTTTLNHPVIISDSSLLKKTGDVGRTSCMNRINSAVLRKLSKDNLIHGSDLKLMELIGQGKLTLAHAVIRIIVVKYHCTELSQLIIFLHLIKILYITNAYSCHRIICCTTIIIFVACYLLDINS